MPDISSVGSGPLSPLGRSSYTESARTLAAAPVGRTTSPSRVDQVEVSDQARYLAAMKAMPDVRADLVQRIKSQIADGTYDSDAKLDSALDRMIDELA